MLYLYVLYRFRHTQIYFFIVLILNFRNSGYATGNLTKFPFNHSGLHLNLVEELTSCASHVHVCERSKVGQRSRKMSIEYSI